MSAKLIISNRQRGIQLDLPALRKTYEQLRQAVMHNLNARPPAHLDAKALPELAERGQFSIAFVSDRRIQTLNKNWMGKDRPTDVLSFPLELKPPPMATLPWEVGEIIISVERAQQQAFEYGHSLERELGFLFVHGMLHVLGFDHMKPNDEKDMFGRQKQILDEVGLKR